MTAPLEQTLTENVPGEATAGTDNSFVVGRAPHAATVTAVTYTPEAAITGANTNYRRVALVNRAQDGTGTAVVAELSFTSGVNATAYDEKTVTLSGTAASLQLASGDILEWVSDAVGTGLADPGGLVKVVYTRN